MGVMLSKESVKKRIQSEEGMSFTEFSYPLLQGYDFFHLATQENISVQIGGSDQWGNIVAGIELARKSSGKELFGLTFPLLLKSDGSKFGKSESGAVWLSENKLSPFQFYQYFINVADADVFTLLRKITFLDLAEIEELEKGYQAGKIPPNTAQERLAAEVTRQVHGEEGLQKALKVTQSIKPGQSLKQVSAEALQEIARDMPSVKLPQAAVVGQKLIDIFPHTKLVSSKGEFRRLLKNGGILLNQEKVDDESYTISREHLIDNQMLVLGVGKKKKLLVQVED
jgi:tyrosyl-tRNA synthetase